MVEGRYIDEDNHYIFMVFCVIKCRVQIVGKCLQCNSDFINEMECKLGFANKLIISCNGCEWNTITFTSLPMKKMKIYIWHV